MLFYTRCDQKFVHKKSLKEQLSLAESRYCILPMPEPIERSVRIQNIRFLHSRDIFTSEFFNFIRKTVHSSAPARVEKMVSSFFNNVHFNDFNHLLFFNHFSNADATVRRIIIVGHSVSISFLIPYWIPYEENVARSIERLVNERNTLYFHQNTKYFVVFFL